MVDTAVTPVPAPTPPRRRPWWRTLWFLAPLLFLVVLVVSRVVYWRTSIAYHPLPVHVPGHAVVNLQLRVRQPACPKGTTRYLSAVVTIHWHAMISPHATRLNLLAGQPHRIALCG